MNLYPNAMPCGCDPTKRTFINVGKAVVLRNRLQRHVDASRWIAEFMDEPHGHELTIWAWYMPKRDLLIAEATLIDFLKPIRNYRDIGFGRPDVWPPRSPDISGGIEHIAQIRNWHRERVTYFRNEPAVYAWSIDPGGDLLAMYELVGEAFKGMPAVDLSKAAELEQAMAYRKQAAKGTEWFSEHIQYADAEVSKKLDEGT